VNHGHRARRQLAHPYRMRRRRRAEVGAVCHTRDLSLGVLSPPGFVGDLIRREDQVMARKSPYPAELRRRAVAMVAEVRSVVRPGDLGGYFVWLPTVSLADSWLL
jgi:hypothetical protein